MTRSDIVVRTVDWPVVMRRVVEGGAYVIDTIEDHEGGRTFTVHRMDYEFPTPVMRPVVRKLATLIDATDAIEAHKRDLRREAAAMKRGR